VIATTRQWQPTEVDHNDLTASDSCRPARPHFFHGESLLLMRFISFIPTRAFVAVSRTLPAGLDNLFPRARQISPRNYSFMALPVGTNPHERIFLVVVSKKRKKTKQHGWQPSQPPCKFSDGRRAHVPVLGR
jgi:hypothetical protein